MWALILHPSNHHSIIIEALPPSYSQASGLSTICVDIKGVVAKIPLPTSPQDESRTPGPPSYHHNETKGRENACRQRRWVICTHDRAMRWPKTSYTGRGPVYNKGCLVRRQHAVHFKVKRNWTLSSIIHIQFSVSIFAGHRYDEDNVLYAECRTTNSRCQSVAIFAQIYRKQSQMNTRRIPRDDRRLSRFKSEGG